MRVVKGRSRSGAELVAAFRVLALVDDPARNRDRALHTLGVLPHPGGVLGLNPRNLRAAALQAGDAIRPAHRFEVIHTDRKSTRLNSSHRCISYAVFCL